jgi:hypothetical protein
VSTDQTSSKPVTPEPVDLDEAQKLCDEATSGPWAWRGYDDGAIELRARLRGGTRIVTTLRSEPCVAETFDNSLVLLEGACATCRRAYDNADLGEMSRCEKEHNLNTVWVAGKGVIRPINEWAVREVPYRADVAEVTHPDARFIARSRDLMPRLIAETREGRLARDLADAAVVLHQAQYASPNDYGDAFRAWRDALSAYLKSKGLGTGEFCEEHWSWLCATGQGKCQAQARAAEPELRAKTGEEAGE